jgi:hypothetical protein
VSPPSHTPFAKKGFSSNKKRILQKASSFKTTRINKPPRGWIF